LSTKVGGQLGGLISWSKRRQSFRLPALGSRPGRIRPCCQLGASSVRARCNPRHLKRHVRSGPGLQTVVESLSLPSPCVACVQQARRSPGGTRDRTGMRLNPDQPVFP
jgi:hypothetical protein